MRKRVFPLGVLALVLACSFALAVEPPNLAPHKQQIRDYVKSGEYDRDIAAVAAQARAWIEERAKQGGGKLAVVFDLDETLISNWPETDREDFGYLRAEFGAWIESAKCPAIESVREVYKTAHELGVKVIYITGRPERFRAATDRNLHAIDCADHAVFICRPDNSNEPAAAFKSAERTRLEAEGYVIIANIGDQETDLAGGHAERTFKLPNPFYLTK